jgi:hypothetical protein
MEAGESKKIRAQFTLDKPGMVGIYAYLFDGIRRLDRKIEKLRVIEP